MLEGSEDRQSFIKLHRGSSQWTVKREAGRIWGRTWGAEEGWARRAEGCAMVSLCSGAPQQLRREAQPNIPLSVQGRWLSLHLFFSLPHQSHHPRLRSCHASVILSFSVRFKSPFKGPSRVSAVLAQKASLISCLFSFANGGGGGRRERASGF